MTYKQAFDLMTEEYIHGKVNAWDAEFCFCGNLEGHTSAWTRLKVYEISHEAMGSAITSYNIQSLKHVHWRNLNYSGSEYLRMEIAFMSPLRAFFIHECPHDYQLNKDWVDAYNRSNVVYNKEYEDALYEGFVAALEVLKAIHISRGEVIEEDLVFKRKKPVMALK